MFFTTIGNFLFCNHNTDNYFATAKSADTDTFVD